MPGRGLDAIGYVPLNGDKKVKILFGEAKVSGEKSNPPQVVDKSKDSIYKNHLNFKSKKEVVIKKLSDLCKRLDMEDAQHISYAIAAIALGMDDLIEFVHGCFLLRDHECCDKKSDFGKMKSNSSEFDPGQIHFVIYELKATIEKTTDQFFDEVQRLCKQ